MTKKSVFYKIYFALIGVFLILLAAALYLLYTWLGAYEESRPEAAIEALYSDYIKKGNLYAIKEKCGLNISPYETEETMNAAFSSLIDGKDLALHTDAANQAENGTAYIVTMAGKPLLSIKLKQQNKGGKFGLKPYDVAEAALVDSYFHSITITAPSDAALLINGVAIENETPTPHALSDVLKKKANGATLVVPSTYKLEKFLSESPVVTAKDAQRFAVTGEKGVYSVRQVLSADTEKQIKDFSLLAAQTYAAHMQNDVSLGKVAQYMDTDTEFYKNVKTSLVVFAWRHNGYSFENNQCGDVYSYSDKLCRCRITFTQVLYLGEKTYSDPFDQYVYLCKTGNGWKVIDMRQFSEDEV